MDNFSDLVIKASDILDTVENYQWCVGEIANEVVERYGFKALEDFSKQIESTGGVRRSPGTLRFYAYIWKKSTALNLPKDILFSGCVAIVFSKDPERYAKLAKEGMSGTELRKLIYEEKQG